MAKAANANTAASAERPIWDGLFGEDARGPYLVGGRCAACGFITLGARPICPACLAEGTMGDEPIGRTGTLYTATVIHQAPAGFAAPYAVGYVDLDDGVRVFAHIETKPRPAIGSPVRLTLAALKTDADGTPRRGPLYRAAGAE